MRRAFVVSIGSFGDLHPFLGLGGILRDLGFEIHFFANEFFEKDVISCAHSFHSIGPQSDYEELLGKARPSRFLELADLLAEYLVLRPMSRTYDAICALEPGNGDILVIHPLALGARLIANAYPVQSIGTQLSPYGIPSVKDPVHLRPGLKISWLPEWCIRLGISWVYGFIDRRLLNPLNDLARARGMKPISSVYPWVLDCDHVLGLFPGWFAPRALDWPRQMIPTTFPLYQEGNSLKEPQNLADFLQSGEAPVIFTQGTPNARADNFFRAAARVCKTLGLRGIFLSPHSQDSLLNLPSNLIHFPMVPLEALIPRCRAVVHHGGIGTSARALHGGKPQVVVPWGVDQFDNARRLVELGVGVSISFRTFLERQLQQSLQRVLHDEEIHQRAEGYAQRLKEEESGEVIKGELQRLLF